MRTLQLSEESSHLLSIPFDIIPTMKMQPLSVEFIIQNRAEAVSRAANLDTNTVLYFFGANRTKISFSVFEEKSDNHAIYSKYHCDRKYLYTLLISFLKLFQKSFVHLVEQVLRSHLVETEFKFL